jgi:hypothetical protein
VPRRGGIDKVEAHSGGRRPGLEVSLDDLDAGEPREVLPGLLGQARPEFHAGDQEAAAGQRDRGQARRTADFQQPVAASQAGQPDQLGEEFGGVFGPRLLIEPRGRLEGAAELISIIGHRVEYPLFRLFFFPPARMSSQPGRRSPAGESRTLILAAAPHRVNRPPVRKCGGRIRHASGRTRVHVDTSMAKFCAEHAAGGAGRGRPAAADAHCRTRA